MKKTFNINVAGYPFIIDDDAYTLLSDYLDTIEHAFSYMEDSQELINDIEARIAELLLELTNGAAIVTVDNVEDVIRRVGKPEEIAEEDDSISVNTDSEGDEVVTETIIEEETQTPPPFSNVDEHVKKKLYRDPQNSMVGGVCAGFGWYLNVDPTWVRLITVFLTLVSVSTCGIAYIILWIVLPPANTPLQRMQMMGESPTMENIGRTVTDTFREEMGQRSSGMGLNNGSRLAQTASETLSIFAKALIILGLIIGFPILVALAIALLGCVFFLIMYATSSVTGFLPDWLTGNDGTVVLYSVICGVGGVIVIGIPLAILLYMGISKNKGTMSKSMKWILITLWILGFLTSSVSAAYIVGAENKRESSRHHDHGWVEAEEVEYYDTIDSVSAGAVTLTKDSADEINLMIVRPDSVKK